MFAKLDSGEIPDIPFSLLSARALYGLGTGTIIVF